MARTTVRSSLNYYTLISNPTKDISLYGFTDAAYHHNIYPKIFFESFVPYEAKYSPIFNDAQLREIQRSIIQSLQPTFELVSVSGMGVAKLSIALTAAKFENNIPVMLYPISNIWSGSDDIFFVIEAKLKDSQSDNTLSIVYYKVSSKLLRSKVTTSAQLTVLATKLASNAALVATGLHPNNFDINGLLHK